MDQCSASDKPLIKSEEWSEEHDQVPLKQRLKILRPCNQILDSRKTEITALAIPSLDIKEDEDRTTQHVNSAHFPEWMVENMPMDDCQSDRPGKCSSHKIDQNTCYSSDTTVVSELNARSTKEQVCSGSESTENNLSSQSVDCSKEPCSSEVQVIKAYTLDDLDFINLKERRRMLLSRKSLESTKPLSQDNITGFSTNVVDCLHDGLTGKQDAKGLSAKENSANVLSGEQNTILISTLATSVNVKAEPTENNELAKNVLDTSLITNFLTIKSEPDIADASLGDDLDHMLLGERMKLLQSRESGNTDVCAEDSRKIVLSSLDCQPISSESATPRIIKRSRKRKKTATDSVETALEEDAPGLLQVLVDKGVLMDEIKLYGQTEIDEALDESLTENSFSELETVLSKLFSQRPSLLKIASLKGVKGEKISYCLACLISLVEQARHLQFRRWPVEWGWCRDLQSFIFVFERHNRIVLERPEYGYATYFFELVNYLTIDWQIKRLVTTMKLTSCSRSALIENKALTVGEDLTQSEARVLEEYGWIPDTGLGTMLNYRDRVVHDRKNELDDSSEWKSKIGKMLMDGYNGGTIVATSIPQKFVDSRVHDPQIKLEI